MPHPLDDFWPSLFGLLSEEAHRREWVRLQECFWLRTGKPAQDGTHESRMQAFQEWMFLDGPAPCRLSRLVAQGKMGGALSALASSLATAHPGLFVLMAPWKKTAWFRDLLGGADFQVHEQPPIFGLAPGQIVQSRVFFHGDSLWLTLGRIVHPEHATEAIFHLLHRLRARGFSDLDILHALMKMEWRSRLHPRMNPAAFYDPANPMVQDILASLAAGPSGGNPDYGEAGGR